MLRWWGTIDRGFAKPSKTYPQTRASPPRSRRICRKDTRGLLASCISLGDKPLYKRPLKPELSSSAARNDSANQAVSSPRLGRVR
jgi:hypothetical protein